MHELAPSSVRAGASVALVALVVLVVYLKSDLYLCSIQILWFEFFGTMNQTEEKRIVIVGC